MNIVYYMNPAVFLIEQNKEIHMQLGTTFDIILDKEKHKEFIRMNREERSRGISVKELMEWFSVDELLNMINHNILIDTQIDLEDRYSRNELFYHVSNKIDSKKLREKEILILGAGAVGSNMLWLFGTVGVKKITILDFDKVEKSNLNRQFFYDAEDVGRPKLEVLQEKFPKFNKDTEFETITKKIKDENEIEELVTRIKPDMMILAIDTPHEVHEWVNHVCVRNQVPYVSGGFMADKGIIGPTYVPRVTDCFECVDRGKIESSGRMAGTGATFSPIVEYVTSSLFAESIKILSGMNNQLRYGGEMYMYDWEQNTLTKFPSKKHKVCPVCGKKHEEVKKEENRIIQLIYYVACFLLPVINTYIGGNIPFLLTGLVVINMLPLLTKSEKKAYETVIGGSIGYIAGLGLMTVLTNAMVPDWTQGIAKQIYDLLLTVLTIISLGSVIFLGIQVIMQTIKGKAMEIIRKERVNA